MRFDLDCGCSFVTRATLSVTVHPSDGSDGSTATSNVQKGSKGAKGWQSNSIQCTSPKNSKYLAELDLVRLTVDQCYLSNLHCTSSQCQTTATENLNIAEASCKGYKILQDLLISESLIDWCYPTGQAWLEIIMSHKHDCSQKLLAAQTLWAWSLSSDIRYPPPYTTMSLCHYVALHWTSYNPGLMVLSPGRPLPRCLADMEVETAVKTPTSKWANFFATCLCLRLLISLARKQS